MKKIMLSGLIVVVVALFLVGCAKEAAEQTTSVSDKSSTAEKTVAGEAVGSVEEQGISASADDLNELDTMSNETDTDVNFDDLEELTK